MSLSYCSPRWISPQRYKTGIIRGRVTMSIGGRRGGGIRPGSASLLLLPLEAKPVVGRVRQILTRAEIALSGLEAGIPSVRRRLAAAAPRCVAGAAIVVSDREDKILGVNI